MVERHLVCDVYVNKRFRHKGLGKLLYETALRKNKYIWTKIYAATSDAQRVWTSLCKKYKSKKDRQKGTITVYDLPKSN
jgi:GNAT superfamily N-acetyltransferase